MRPILVPALACLFTLSACDDSSEDGGDRPSPGDHDGGGGDAGGDDGGEPASEGDCTDGVDGDDDGDIDCADSDCAGEFECTWPDAIAHSSRFAFDGYTIECEAFGIEFDYDVPDCTTALTATLNLYEAPDSCTQCDRSYHGTFAYSEDSCSELLETTPPTEGKYGFVFVSETERELWGQDEAGQWAFASLLTSTDGKTWELGGSEEVWDDPEDCDNGMQLLGNITVLISFVDQ